MIRAGRRRVGGRMSTDEMREKVLRSLEYALQFEPPFNPWKEVKLRLNPEDYAVFSGGDVVTTWRSPYLPVQVSASDEVERGMCEFTGVPKWNIRVVK